MDLWAATWTRKKTESYGGEVMLGDRLVHAATKRLDKLLCVVDVWMAIKMYICRYLVGLKTRRTSGFLFASRIRMCKRQLGRVTAKP